MSIKAFFVYFGLIIWIAGTFTASAAPLHPSYWQEGKKNSDPAALNLIQKQSKAPQLSGPSYAPSWSPQRATATTGEIKVVVIPVGFSGMEITEAQITTLKERLFSTTANSTYKFFHEASYSLMEFKEGTTSVAVNSTKAATYYGQDGSDIDNANGPIWKLAEEAVTLADVPGKDLFKPYATVNASGKYVVDHVIIVHSHAAQEVDGQSDKIWSHRWHIGGSALDSSVWYKTTSTTSGGNDIYVSNYAMFAIDSPVGIMAHEFGHEMGLIDYYNTSNFSDYGIGDWGLMSTGCWLGGGTARDGSKPAHPSPLCKKKLGWITYNDISGQAGTFSINHYTAQTSCYQIKLGNDNEYLLVTNRQKTGYDAELPGAGLLVWHIDETKIDNNDTYRRRAHVVQAGGGSVYSRGTSSDPFYSGNATEFTPQTTPAAVSYSKNHSAHIDSIGASGMTMSFRNRLAFYVGLYNNPADPNEIMVNVKPNYSISSLSNIKVVAREDSGTSEITMKQVSGGTILIGSYKPSGTGSVYVKVTDSTKVGVSGETAALSSTTSTASLLFTAQRPSNAPGGKITSPYNDLTVFLEDMDTTGDPLITILPVDTSPSGELMPSGRSYMVRTSAQSGLNGALLSFISSNNQQSTGIYHNNGEGWKWAVPAGSSEKIDASNGLWAVFDDAVSPSMEYRWDGDILVVTASDNGSGLELSPVIVENYSGSSNTVLPSSAAPSARDTALSSASTLSPKLSSFQLQPFEVDGNDSYYMTDPDMKSIYAVASDRAGNQSVLTIKAPSKAPAEFVYLNVSPNPAFDDVNFRYSLNNAVTSIRLTLRDSSGALVNRFTDSNATTGDFVWDLYNEDGDKVANGIYFWVVEITDADGKRERRGKIGVVQ